MAAPLSAEELRRRARARRGEDAKEARRWLALWHLAEGRSAAQAAEATGLSHGWVCETVRRYNARGPAGLEEGHRQKSGGPAPRLEAAGQAALAEALEAAVPEGLGGGRWSGRKVAAWVAARTGGRTFHPQQGWGWMQRLGFSLRVPRPRHPAAADAPARAAWKKSGASR